MFAAPLPSFAAAAAAAAAAPAIIFSVNGNTNKSKINRQCKNVDDDMYHEKKIFNAI